MRRAKAPRQFPTRYPVRLRAGPGGRQGGEDAMSRAIRSGPVKGRAWRLAALAGLLALAGCMSPPPRPLAAGTGTPDYDPLVGGVPIPPSNVPGAAKGLVEDDPKPGTLPPVPDANGPTSPAAL